MTHAYLDYLLLLWRKSLRRNQCQWRKPYKHKVCWRCCTFQPPPPPPPSTHTHTNTQQTNKTKQNKHTHTHTHTHTNKQMEKKTTLKQSELRKSESWPYNTQGKDIVHDKPCRLWRYTNWSGKMEKSDRIQIPQTNHTPQRYYKRRNLCHSSVELFC